MKTDADAKKPKIIGRAEEIAFPEIAIERVHARIDTGARTSSLWASRTEIIDDDLHVTLFDGDEARQLIFDEFERVAVASSNGHVQHRFKVRLLVKLKGKKIRAWFTLADRSTQVYPVLIGRNVLLGKFIVDVTKGKALTQAEKQRSERLQATLNEQEEQ